MTSESVYVIIILVRGNEMELDVEQMEKLPTPIKLEVEEHDCFEHAVPYEFYADGRRYHGYDCGLCGELLQTG